MFQFMYLTALVLKGHENTPAPRHIKPHKKNVNRSSKPRVQTEEKCPANLTSFSTADENRRDTNFSTILFIFHLGLDCSLSWVTFRPRRATLHHEAKREEGGRERGRKKIINGYPRVLPLPAFLSNTSLE